MTKNFKFNLDAVLQWKKRQEESALREFGEASRKKIKAFEELQKARRYLGEMMRSLREQRDGGKLSAWNQTMHMKAITNQEGVCKHKEDILAQVTKEEENMREKYLQKHREADGMEKLKEKRRKIFEKEENDRSEKELEEIVLSRAIRDNYAAN